MTILLTGAGGFVGRRVLAGLVAKGITVTAVDRTPCPFDKGHLPVTWIEGDLSDPDCVERAIANVPNGIIHLASLPGGAAEADPLLSFEVNVAASLRLAQRAAEVRRGLPFVFASSIAVIGSELPESGVNDDTPLRPDLVYGVHKLMVECGLTAMARRGELRSLSLRLPGIVARPNVPSQLKSAFLSDVFHALRANQQISVPVSPSAHSWLMSVDQCVDCILHGANVSEMITPDDSALTLPALRIKFEDLVKEISSQLDVDPTLVSYAPDPRIERSFGRYPELSTSSAGSLGFRDDGDLQSLVRKTLTGLSLRESPF